MSTPALAVDNLAIAFGSLQALDGVSLSVAPGEILGLIGPNGSGKTTLFNCVSGFSRPQRGRIRLGDEDVTGKPVEAIARRGCFRTFQLVQLVETLTVIENVLVGLHTSLRTGWFEQALTLPRSRREARECRDKALAMLDQLGLGSYADRQITGLPFGVKRKVELARTLVADVRLVLLDEVSSGLTEAEQSELVEVIDRERGSRGMAVVAISHEMGFVDELCDRVIVLNAGRVIAEGTQAEIRSNPAVIAAYLESPVAGSAAAAKPPLEAKRAGS
jgi:branched-chain amino acid transport system ATP-binding protein